MEVGSRKTEASFLSAIPAERESKEQITEIFVENVSGKK